MSIIKRPTSSAQTAVVYTYDSGDEWSVLEMVGRCLSGDCWETLSEISTIPNSHKFRITITAERI